MRGMGHGPMGDRREMGDGGMAARAGAADGRVPLWAGRRDMPTRRWALHRNRDRTSVRFDRDTAHPFDRGSGWAGPGAGWRPFDPKAEIGDRAMFRRSLRPGEVALWKSIRGGGARSNRRKTPKRVTPSRAKVHPRAGDETSPSGWNESASPSTDRPYWPGEWSYRRTFIRGPSPAFPVVEQARAAVVVERRPLERREAVVVGACDREVPHQGRRADGLLGADLVVVVR